MPFRPLMAEPLVSFSPSWAASSMVEQLTLNQLVQGSSPWRLTNPRRPLQRAAIYRESVSTKPRQPHERAPTVKLVRLPALILSAFVVAMSVVTVAPSTVAGVSCPWMDTSHTAAQRANSLLSAMSPDDEIAMVHNSDDKWSYYGAVGHIAGNARLCIPDLVMNNAGQGVGGKQVDTTAFPAPIAQAATWDPTLEEDFGAHLGKEAWKKGTNVLLAPGLDTGRVPMNGRNFEYFGEDPYLAGVTAAAEVTGLQSQHVIATLKHYLMNDQETNRTTVSADVSERVMQEIYLPGFQAAVDAGAGSVMCSYNKVNGIYACQATKILTNDLKDAFGFSGFVMSDWRATHSTVQSANNGLDMEMGSTVGPYFTGALKTAVQHGEVPRARLDDMVFRILRTMFRVGLFDHPTPAEPSASHANAETTGEIQFARTIAEQGIVLLKDRGGLLPLTGTGQSIAVIGEAASGAGALKIYNGAGSAHVPLFGSKSDVVTGLTGITQRGATNDDSVTYSSGRSIPAAVSAAAAADVAIVFAYDVSGEGVDLPSLDLDQASGSCGKGGCTYQASRQNELIAAVAAANPDTVVVLNTGGPVLMPWAGKVSGIVEAWYPGEQMGKAIARVLFGDVDPSGKLPETFPRKMADLPTRTAARYPGVNGHATYSEGLLVGYRWYDQKQITPLYCFGDGLSYTTFDYSGLKVIKASGGGATVSFSVTNSGKRSGAEVPQVYVAFPSAAGEPPLQLKGFDKVSLAPGETRKVTIGLDSRAFSYWGASGWTVTAGKYGINVGSSSCDIRLQGQITMAG